MKRLLLGLLFANLFFSVLQASPNNTLRDKNQSFTKNLSNNSNLFPENRRIRVQQNLIGEVTAIDQSGLKMTVKTDAGASVSFSFNDKTSFRRIKPGETSITNAEQITFADIKVGDRILVPGGAANEQTPVARIIVISRQAINAQRDQEREARRARTVNGRVTAVNSEKKEITIQSRGRAAEAEILTVSTAGNVKFLRYAPDSLKVSDAVAGSLADLRVGDQIRVIGDRSSDGARVSAEEIISGSIMRTVGSIVEVNAARNEVVVKNGQTGQLMTVAIGKNTTLRRITDDVAKTLKERAKQRAERQNERSNQQNTGGSNPQTQQANRQNRREERRENRNANGGAQQGQGNRGLPQQFENLPTVTVAELKKGDAVLITGTGGADNARMTAVSVVTGDSDLQAILQRTQGGRNNSPNSPGLPGNVSGGNAPDDEDPRNRQ
jgi:hypothetical protein